MYDEVEAGYPSFLAEAHALLSSRIRDPEFGFIVRRLWMEDIGEPRDGWHQTMQARYESFAASWWPQSQVKSKDDQFLKQTLSVWQKRSVVCLSLPAARRLIENASRLVDVLVKP